LTIADCGTESTFGRFALMDEKPFKEVRIMTSQPGQTYNREKSSQDYFSPRAFSWNWRA
jgi:hypothetical protein